MPPPQPLLRRSETALVVYFTYAAIVSFFLPLPAEVFMRTLVVNLTVITAYFLLGRLAQVRPLYALSVVRDWLPLPLVVLAYRQMGWFAPAEHTFELERSWILWDRVLLNDWGLRAAIEFFGPVGPAILEISYSLVYPIAPFSVAVLYLYGRRRQVDRFLLFFVLGALLSYALFPYFPSEPPRAVFPGQDSPRIDTIFRKFNWWLLGGYGIHTSVFPSAHVSGALAAALGMLRILSIRNWVGWFLLALAFLIFVATIYGRYHYAVDGVAGVAVALLAFGIAVKIEKTWGALGPR